MTKFCTLQDYNKHVAIYLCTKFQLFWGISDYWTKFGKKNMTDKNS